MIVDNSIKIADILNLITQTTRRYLTDIRLFDVYEDESLGENKKSLAFTMTFNSKEKTLEASDVDKLINSVIIRLERDLKLRLENKKRDKTLKKVSKNVIKRSKKCQKT